MGIRTLLPGVALTLTLTASALADSLVATYSTFIGTQSDAFYDEVRAIAVDDAGNVYVGGQTQLDLTYLPSDAFPTTPTSLELPTSRTPQQKCSSGCGYILKLNPRLELVFGVLIPSLQVRALAADTTGVYVTGEHSNQELVATPRAFSTAGGLFAMKIREDGTTLEHLALFPGIKSRAITVDELGNSYVAGEVGSNTLPTTQAAVKRTTESGHTDAFLLKINRSGTALVFGTYLGGSADDTASGVVLDGAGGAVVAGRTSSNDFAGFSGVVSGMSDAFVVRVSANGSAILSGRYMGGAAQEEAVAISSDGQGGYLVGGYTGSADFPVTAQALQDRLLGTHTNGWLARLDSNFAVRYSTYLGGSFADGVQAVAGDADGNAYVAGWTYSGDMPTTPDGFQALSSAYTRAFLANAGARFYPIIYDSLREAFFAVISSSGTELRNGSYLGGFYSSNPQSLTIGAAVATDANGSVYLGGSTLARSFPTAAGGLRHSFLGHSDGFLVKLSPQEFVVQSATLLPAARVGESYSHLLQVVGGVGPYRWEVVGFGVPDGLSLHSDGSISGVPHERQRENFGYQFTVRVTDSIGQTAYKSLFLNVVYRGNPRCVPNSCTLEVNTNQQFLFELPFLARGVPPFHLFISGTMPPGIEVDTETGQFGGNPTKAGVYDFDLTMLDALNKQSTIAWRVTVASPAPTPTTPGSATPPTPSPPTESAPQPVPSSSASPTDSSSGGGGALALEFAFLMLLALTRRCSFFRSQHAA